MSFVSLTLLLSSLLSAFVTVNAQLVNGQYFTRGLAISNAPAPNSEYTVGGTIGVSVDVSGDGRLPEESWGPNSPLPSGFISLSLFLISDNYNLTIINGTTGEFLSGEPGSTVKHLNYVIPNCLTEGTYAYTYYEVCRQNGTEYFTITPIDITIKNPGGSSGPCPANVTNTVLPRPQNDSAPAQNPFTGGLALNTSTGTTTGVNTIMSYTQQPAEAPYPTITNDAQAAYDAGLLYPIRRGFSND